VHQRGNRVQRVEQEVRVQLALERLQLRLGQAGLELRRGERAVLRLAVVVHRVAQADDRPVDHHLPVEVQEEELLELRGPGRGPPAERGREGDACADGDQGVQEREREHSARVHRGRPDPGAPFERHTARQPQDRGDQHGPAVPVRHVQREEVLERRLAFGEERHVVVRLERREDAERRRHAEDQAQAHAPRLRGHHRTISGAAGRVKTVHPSPVGVHPRRHGLRIPLSAIRNAESGSRTAE
jgi:hypothetical protein